MMLANKVVVVTGGASGLGEACARMFVENGSKAALLDLSEDNGNRLANELGKDALFCKTDVTDENEVENALNLTMEKFGAIHIAINCAGTGTPAKVIGKNGPLSIASFRKVIDINLVGTMIVVARAAAKMLMNKPQEDGERGVVINTASAAAFDGQIGQAAYSASKAAVVGMTLPIAREFAEYGIRINTIAPGLFDTPMLAGLKQEVRNALGRMVPFPKRLGLPREYALLAKHIVDNPMLNGETIRLDGSLRMAAK
ncbi:SDR family NAD(P)-dependent oxidoreductase [Desulfatitalea tepidiphila]|uniref:SDR family NAD(P)-dependent oxidoreductase n=1 Tax=Desulfatitalea tepidiphila TaxID=1185843 RepID=UPI0006B5D0A0|nr:SDR family NAD(P)-dependent oxidoreductase [Desulfatitalea tepidiphila]